VMREKKRSNCYPLFGRIPCWLLGRGAGLGNSGGGMGRHIDEGGGP